MYLQPPMKVKFMMEQFIFNDALEGNTYLYHFGLQQSEMSLK